MHLPDTVHQLDEKAKDWSFTGFMSIGEFNDPQKSFLVKDSCIVSAEVSVRKVRNEKQVSQAGGLIASLTFEGKTGHTEVEVSRPEPKGQGPKI